MLSHHAMDPEVFQPHITRPLPPGHQLFRSVLIRSHTAIYTAYPPVYTAYPPVYTAHPPAPALYRPLRPTPPYIQETAPGPQTENRLLCRLPPSAFPARPLTHLVSSCAGSVGVLSYPCLSVHTGPSVPEPGSSVPGHRRKVKCGSCLCLLLLQGVPVPSVFPQSSIIMLNK